MIITDFKNEYLQQANELARSNYEEERMYVKELPEVREFPEIDCFAENDLGVAAFEGNRMIGFLGCYLPWENAFGTEANGTFSPIEAHGAVKENRSMIYKRMYQKAAEKWVQAGIRYHGIACYEHDEQMIRAFFAYGFGHRCTDAIRIMEPISIKQSVSLKDDKKIIDRSRITYGEISQDEVQKVRSLRKMLTDHLGQSPCFMYTSPIEFENWLQRVEHRNSRVFVAFDEGEAIAFMEVTDSGENFATVAGDMRNICGAFCLPRYRGQSIYQQLLNTVIRTLHAEGYKRLGVDFESYNPTASGFWLKYFTAYTCSVVRRIDESAQNQDQ